MLKCATYDDPYLVIKYILTNVKMCYIWWLSFSTWYSNHSQMNKKHVTKIIFMKLLNKIIIIFIKSCLTLEYMNYNDLVLFLPLKIFVSTPNSN